jgi:HSP20 family protein
MHSSVSSGPFSLMRRMMEDVEPLHGGIGPAEGRLWSPRIDVFQREGQLIVRADVPGVRKEDVNVELTDDGLVIEGERKAEQNVDEAGVHRVECTYGSFQRVIPVPEGIDVAQAKASFENGVLEVTVPLPKEQTHGAASAHRGAGQDAWDEGSALVSHLVSFEGQLGAIDCGQD